MRNIAKSYFTIIGVINLVAGMIWCLTIIGSIIGIPLMIAAKKLSSAVKMSDDELVARRANILKWGMVSAIFAPIPVAGTIIIFIFALIANSFILKLESGKIEEANRTLGEVVKDGTKEVVKIVKDGTKEVVIDAVKEAKELFKSKPQTQVEIEQLEGINKMKEDGIITQEEFEIKRKRILNVE